MKKKLILVAVACVVALALGALVGCGSSSSGSAASASGSGSAAASATSASTSAASTSASATSASASAASASTSATSASASAAAQEPLANGKYTVTVKTDSSMFHVNEAYKDKCPLTVENGQMTVHMTLASTGIVNLFVGKAADAKAEGAALLPPTLEEVKYPDGTTDKANAFDVPVPVLGEPFDVAIIGEKGTWYDHVVTVSDPEPAQ